MNGEIAKGGTNARTQGGPQTTSSFKPVHTRPVQGNWFIRGGRVGGILVVSAGKNNEV